MVSEKDRENVLERISREEVGELTTDIPTPRFLWTPDWEKC